LCVVAQPRRKQVQPPSGAERAFGKALREIRKGKGISQEQLAMDADFDRTFTSLLERGLRSPTMRTVVRLSDALEVRPSEIVSRMEDFLPKRRKASR
jgi:transcriptional regulator with XRE-family HTH domain